MKLSKTEELGILAPIKDIILKNPQAVITYIKTHFDEIIQRIDKIQDTTTGDRLRRIIILLSGRETEELLRCINDVRSWPYRAGYDIDLYIERPNLFLIGGKSKYDGEIFLGVYNYCKDLDIRGTLYEVPEVRKLLTYKEELEFFRQARYNILKSIKEEGKWEDFYKFYHNLRSGEKYIQKVKEKFGNEEFANLLERVEEKIHESPIDWANELGVLSERLIKQAYPLVIEPAAQAFIRIFDARIQELNGKKAEALRDLWKLLNEQDLNLKIKKEFAEILRKRRKKLKAELEKERQEFDSLKRDLIVILPEFESRISFVESKMQMEHVLLYEYKILDKLSSWRKFGLDRSKVLTLGENVFQNDDSIRLLTQFIAEEYKASEIAEEEAKLKKYVEDAYHQCIPVLKELITTGDNIILRRMNNLISHINSKLPQCIPEVMIMLKSNYHLEMIQKEGQKANVIDLEKSREKNAKKGFENIQYQKTEVRRAA